MRFIALLALAGCAGAPGTEITADKLVGATSDPHLVQSDLLVPFAPGLFRYSRARGSVADSITLGGFGVTHWNLQMALDVLPHNDLPDAKMRARVTLQDVTKPIGNPNGEVIVHGLIYGRSPDPTKPATSSNRDSKPLNFITNGTLVTEEYFDAITSIETRTGLGVDVDVTVELWNGHEQEADIGVTIGGVADETACEDDYRVHFNGQVATPDWDPATSSCSAGLYAGSLHTDGKLVSHAAVRGLYLPVDPDFRAADSYHHYTRDEDGDFGDGASTWQDWVSSAGAAAMWFAVDDHLTNDTRERPIAVTLERLSDGAIVDAARVMMPVTVDAHGAPSLAWLPAGFENPGAIAQLSPRGLDRLSPTHQDTLPYPIVPAGTQPRLSQTAIGDAAHESKTSTSWSTLSVNLGDLPETSPDDELGYWTEQNADPSGPQFAGYRAYKNIYDAAVVAHAIYKGLKNACASAPFPQLCRAALDVSYCVQDDPKPEDFEIRVTNIHTYFDPARTGDALVVGDIQNLHLAFATGDVRSSFGLAAIRGWLQASIDLADIEVGYAGGPITCTIKPPARSLADFAAGTQDYENWLVCHDLSFFSPSGALSQPVGFDIAGNGEDLMTPYQSNEPTVSLARPTTAPGTGICTQSWIEPAIYGEIANWQYDIEQNIAAELRTSPGEDEALKRLLSPYELGITSVTAPPKDTPPYDVHPLPTYDLEATIAKSAGDNRGIRANASDGMYLPYMTQSAPIAGTDAFDRWFCPIIAGQTCDGDAGMHEPMLVGGLDPDGAPYDVSINYTTAHLSQALWAQARRSDRLGSPGQPARLALSDTALVDRARLLGFVDVADALAAAGPKLGVRYHQEAAPYAIATDASPPRLLYVTPNIVLEIVSIDASGSEAVVAKLMVDIVDFDHSIALRTGGVPGLFAHWGNKVNPVFTTTFLPGCYGSTRKGTTSCNEKLSLLVGTFWLPVVEPLLIDMMEQMPALARFDSAAESHLPRQLKNVRTFIAGEGVVLVGDLCDPLGNDCELP
jgi:hypothetical protein